MQAAIVSCESKHRWTNHEGCITGFALHLVLTQELALPMAGKHKVAPEALCHLRALGVLGRPQALGGLGRLRACQARSLDRWLRAPRMERALGALAKTQASARRTAPVLARSAASAKSIVAKGLGKRKLLRKRAQGRARGRVRSPGDLRSPPRRHTPDCPPKPARATLVVLGHVCSIERLLQCALGEALRRSHEIDGCAMLGFRAWRLMR